MERRDTVEPSPTKTHPVPKLPPIKGDRIPRTLVQVRIYFMTQYLIHLLLFMLNKKPLFYIYFI